MASLNGVSHRYGATRALDAVTLEISRPAGWSAFIGPDGVGKSTLLGLIAGAAGDADRRGHGPWRRHAPTRGTATAVCPRIAYMPQGLGSNLYPDLSVRENIEFFARLFGQPAAERERRIAELLAGTGLAPFRRSRRQAISRAACGRSSVSAARWSMIRTC